LSTAGPGAVNNATGVVPSAIHRPVGGAVDGSGPACHGARRHETPGEQRLSLCKGKAEREPAVTGGLVSHHQGKRTGRRPHRRRGCSHGQQIGSKLCSLALSPTASCAREPQSGLLHLAPPHHSPEGGEKPPAGTSPRLLRVVMDNRRLSAVAEPAWPGNGGEVNVEAPGRSCPLAYQYRPEALAQPAQVQADTLFVVGGLYGNAAALQAVLQRADREPGGPATIAFNGDFHWLDVDPEDFRTISETVLAHHASKGNVEAELASEEDAGCGCAYPEYVSDKVVDRSNQIMTRLRATAMQFPGLVRRLGELPRFLTASVGGQRVGIVHGDPRSLAGWRLQDIPEPRSGWPWLRLGRSPASCRSRRASLCGCYCAAGAEAGGRWVNIQRCPSRSAVR
jgi:hypothetical protein